MSEIGGNLEGAPYQAGLSQGETYADQSRLARQKQRQRDMRQRVVGFFFSVMLVALAIFFWAVWTG